MREIQEVKAQNKWACIFCDKEFKYSSEKTRHEKSHSMQFKCKVCCKKFGFLSALRRHETQHQRTGPVECEECKRNFRDNILLKRHIKYAHEGIYTCPKCLSTFSSEVALNTHLKVHKPKAERQYHCSHSNCDKSFNFPHHLKHHELTHTNSKQHFCFTCGKGFIQPHHLKIHLKTHEPENWLLCPRPGCGKKFTTEYARKRHLATHKPKSKSSPSSRPLAIQDSNEYVELAETTKDGSLCPACGDMVPKNKLPSHALKCIIQNNEDVSTHGFPVNLMKDTELSNLENESHHTIELENLCLSSNDQDEMLINDKESYYKTIVEEPAPIKQDVDREFINFTNDCKSVLGGCLMSGSSQNEENCLCAKMTPSLKFTETLLLSDERNDYEFKKENCHSNKDLTDFNDKNNECKGCNCENTSQTKQNVERLAVVPNKCSIYQETMPKIQYKLDGVIKIEETFDINLATLYDDGMKNNYMKKESEISVPLNSCKDVLGNCIVSGNDTIGEGCLCARMAMETQQATAQEIEEISICPQADRSGKQVCGMDLSKN